MEERELRRYILEAFRNMDQETRHISFEEIAGLASGKISGARSKDMEHHLAECALCRERLQDFEQFVMDAQIPASGDLTDEWKELRSRLRPQKKVAVMRRWLPTVAAAGVLAAGLAWISIDRILNNPQRLLRRAYQEHRPSDIRFAGAEHSDVRVQMGSGSQFDLPESLSQATTRLKEDLRKNPDDPDLLRLRGEAELIDHHADAAVQTLERAADLRSSDSHVLADLGAAYAVRGDLETRKADYSKALDYLGRSIKLQPQSPEAIFNRALVLERLQVFDQAIEEWERYLQIDKAGEWADEARQHLARLRAKLAAWKGAWQQVTEEDPASFLRRVANKEAVDQEAYQHVAVTQWLPLASANEVARAAVNKLGQLLQQDHGDSWLSDLASAGWGPQESSGLKQLATARLANQRARDAKAALAASSRASQYFLRAHGKAGIFWARFEEVYGFHVDLKSTECLAAAERLAQDLVPYPYRWLKAQNQIEYGVCALRVGRLDEAKLHFISALQESQSAGFGDTALRASGIYLESLSYVTPPSEVYARADEALQIFWNGSYPPMRFYQVVEVLLDRSREANLEFTSYFLARSARWAARLSHDPIVEPGAIADLAVAARAIGEESEAENDVTIADRLLTQVQNPALAAYNLDIPIKLALLDLERGNVEAALRRLETFQEAFASPPTPLLGAQYYSVLGETYRRQGLLAQAAEAFRKSIAFGEIRIASLVSERQHAGVLKTIENSYRGLVATTLAIPGGSPEEAFRIWQQYRASDATGQARPFHEPDDVVLSYVELPEGFVGWVVRGGQVMMRPLPVAKQEIRMVASSFLRRCSDWRSSRQSLRQEGRQLYDWIIGPFADFLFAANPKQRLVVELDGVLAAIPIQALMDRDGAYLGDQFLVLSSVGYATTPLRSGSLDRSARALAIVNPTILGAGASEFPTLPDSLDEARAVQATFPASIVVAGQQATVEALIATLPSVEIVHFSGHGYTNAESGALLFSPADPKKSDYDALRSIEVSRQDWSRVRLVVLSACAAAAGETRGPHNPESLVRALTKAGAPQVAASLWNVDSGPTLKLMNGFYAALGQGQSPAQALRTAQQSLRQRAAWAHPHYWAGFQLYGTT